jgi:hypothetical protein
VIKRVLVGVTGCVRGGKLERSSFSEAREDARLVEGLEGAEFVGDVDMLDGVSSHCKR